MKDAYAMREETKTPAAAAVVSGTALAVPSAADEKNRNRPVCLT